MQRIITAPVMIPNTPDCTYLRGEPVFSKEQIKKFKEDFDKYGIIDLEHDFKETGKTRGEPVNSWLLPEDQRFTLLNGQPIVYPEGTWMLTSKITDPKSIQLLDNGQIKGYSSSTVEKEVAEERYNMLKGKEANKSKTLIVDLDEPTTYAVTLTSSPCVFQSKFCKLNNKEANKNNGDNMDDATLLKKFKDFLKSLGSEPEEEEEQVEGEEATKCGGSCKGKKEANKTAVGSTTNEDETVNEPPKKNPEQIDFLNKLEDIKKQIEELQEANKATNERIDDIAKTVQEAEKSKKEVEEPEKEPEEEQVEEPVPATKKEANKSKQFDSEDGFEQVNETPMSETQLVYEAMGRSITGSKL